MESMYELLKDNRYIDYFMCKEAHDMEGWTDDEIARYRDESFKKLEAHKQPYENPYMHIQHFAEKAFNSFTPGDAIVIQEKVDGSNAHIRLTNSGFRCWGQNYELNEYNHLQGFWYWCRDHFHQIPERLKGLDIYGEWLVPHHCVYRPECYGEFYVFDIMKDGKYLNAELVFQMAEACGFKQVSTFMSGVFSSWASVYKYIGKTTMGVSGGEGIVVKNQTELNSPNKMFYVKLVAKEYQETNASRKEVKLTDLDKILAIEEMRSLTGSIVTSARVRKNLLKMIDEGELPALWQHLQFNQVQNALKRRVYNDCRQEESEVVQQVGGIFGKYCNDYVGMHLKALWQEGMS